MIFSYILGLVCKVFRAAYTCNLEGDNKCDLYIWRVTGSCNFDGFSCDLDKYQL